MSSIEQPTLNYQTIPLEYKSNRTRTVITLCALGLVLLALLGATAAGFMQLAFLHRAAAGEAISTADAQRNDIIYGGAHLALLIMFIFCFVAVPVWMYRAHKNLRPLPQRVLIFTPKGAAGWWFCPFINLVRPYQAMKEIVNVSFEGTQQQIFNRAYPLLGFWWFFWITGNIVSRIANAVVQSSNTDGIHVPTIDDFINRTWANMIDIPFLLIAGLMLMWIIFSVEKMQSNQASVQLEPAPALSRHLDPPLL